MCVCVCMCVGTHVCGVHTGAHAKVNALTGGLRGRPRLTLGVGWSWQRPVSCLHPCPHCQEMEVYMETATLSTRCFFLKVYKL